MSLFRRKHESERAAEQPDQVAEPRERELGPENARPGEEERSPGVIVAPVAGEIVSGLVEVQIVPDEAVTGPVLLEWRSDAETSWRRAGAEERADEATSKLLGWDTGTLDDGSYRLRLVATLSSGSEVTSESVSVLVDNLGPEIRLREPLDGQTISGFVTIAVEVEDSVSDVSVVELEIAEGGEDWRRIAEARWQPFELRWSSEALADGAYQLRIGARDASGNLALIGPFEVEIANGPVAAELVDPGELLRGTVNLIARTPDLRSTQMIFELAQAGSSDWQALGTTRAPFHLSVDTGQSDDGRYELRIESISAEGKSVYSRRFGPYVFDNTPPAITIVKPAPGETLQDWAELVIEVADDVSGPARVELSYNEGEKWVSLARLEPEKGKVRGYWQLAECRPGSCRLRATAFDRAGNEASEEITVTITAPAASEPERAPRPELIPTPEPRAPAPPTRPPSATAAGRFGQVPSWDWKRHRPPGAERTAGAASGAVEETKARQPDPEPVAAEAEPVSAAAPREKTKKSAAWTWKSSGPRSEPSKQPEPEEEPVAPPKVKKAQSKEPESKKEHEPEQESEPEARAEAKPVQSIHLVDSAPDDEQPEIDESENERPDSGAGESGRVVNVDFARAARGWDIWELSELVEETPGQDPAREEERRQILYHLREHTSVDGRIPPEFEDLVREAFGELISGDRSS